MKPKKVKWMDVEGSMWIGSIEDFTVIKITKNPSKTYSLHVLGWFITSMGDSLKAMKREGKRLLKLRLPMLMEQE